MRKRKALTQGQLVVLIVTIVGFIILLPITSTFVDKLLNQQDMEACRTSIIAASTGKVPVYGKTMDFDCTRGEVEISTDDVTVDNHVNKLELKRQVAEQLRRCNYMTGEGSVDPYKKKKLEETAACLICSEITFSEGLADENLTGLDLFSYLQNTEIEKGKQEGDTYLEYLRKNRNEKTYSKNPYRALQNISVKEDYYTLHMLTHSARWWAIPGASSREMSSAIIFVKKQDLHEVGCDYIAN